MTGERRGEEGGEIASRGKTALKAAANGLTVPNDDGAAFKQVTPDSPSSLLLLTLRPTL